jgi:DNA-directed RNA polymerase sigma subunit (sigma70/sigma32)
LKRVLVWVQSAERVTLESIGQRYGITRERVRQIENHALAALKKSPAFTEANAAFHELERIIDSARRHSL